MDYFRQIDDDLKSLGHEAKRKYPEVKDATERAAVSLKTIREAYIADIRKGTPEMKGHFPTSSDITAPYILACNHAQGDPKMISMALSGIHLLLNFEVVPIADLKNILRVLCIQVNANRSEFHLKMLQIMTQIVNMLSRDAVSVQHLTDTTVSSLLNLALQLCDARSSVSVAATAFATTRQIITLVMEETQKLCAVDTKQKATVAQNTITLTAVLLVKDLSLFVLGKSGEWIRNAGIPQQYALAIKSLLRTVQDDFLIAANRYGLVSSAALSTRIIRLARCVLLHYVNPSTIDDVDLILTLLVHTLQPNRAGSSSPKDTAHPPTLPHHGNLGGKSNSHAQQNPNSSTHSFEETLRSKFDEATSLFTTGTSANLMSKLSFAGSSSGAAVNTTHRQSTPAVASNTSSAPVNRAQLTGADSYLTLVSVGPAPLTSKSQSNSITLLGSSRQETVSQLLAHPAGAGLEALLSFFLSDLALIVQTEAGSKFLTTALINTTVSVSILLCGGLASESNRRDFDAAIRGSQLMTLLEGVLSGAETDVDYILRTVHELLITTPSMGPSDVLVLAFELLQICMRLLLKLSLELFKRKSVTSSSNIDVSYFVPPEVLSKLPLNCTSIKMATLQKITVNVCEAVYETVLDACLGLLNNMEYTAIVRRTLGMLSELVMCTGIVGLARPCNILVAYLCKLTVPHWHGQEIADTVVPTELLSDDPFRWRHMQALVRLLQIIHVVADQISDWDTIVDAIEQLLCVVPALSSAGSNHATAVGSAAPSSSSTSLASSNGMKFQQDILSADLDKVSFALERFKSYSSFISDDSLVHLMTSLVGLSVNNMGGGAKINSRVGGKSQYGKGIRIDINSAPVYMVDAINEGLIGFSFQAVVEITKFNSHRVACIWQMVTSHLRMIASQKNPKIRAVAVAATHDVILSSLSYLVHPCIPPVNMQFIDSEILPAHLVKRGTVLLSDEIVFHWILPSLETVFCPRVYHRNCLVERDLLEEDSQLLKLSRSDLFSSLKVLSSVRYEDVKNGVINGLLLMLQNCNNGGQILSTAWMSIVNIISQVPEAHVDLTDQGSVVVVSDESDDAVNQQSWSKTSLSLAFSCIEIIVDEFLELLELRDIVGVISSLSLFAQQIYDVNISLTSLEMLWKVTDLTVTGMHLKGNKAGIETVLDVMLTSMQRLSMDARPEIRHCAMNTLFGALTAHAVRLSTTRWKTVFEEALFPLFSRATDRTTLAMRRNEVAIAPELKKGVKMTVHHSRDTAQKQWSETQVLALRGLGRVFKSCTKVLIKENWFSSTWNEATTICKGAMASGTVDLEVSTAGLDCLFAMLKMVSLSSSAVSSNVSATATVIPSELAVLQQVESQRDILWIKSWEGLRDATYFDSNTPELSLHFCKNLASYYNISISSEFRYSQHVRVFLGMLVMLARPRCVGTQNVPQNKVTEVQLHRSIMEALRKVAENSIDVSGFVSLISALSDICFANQYMSISGDTSSTSNSVLLQPCPLKLREDAGELLKNLMVDPQYQCFWQQQSVNDSGSSILGSETAGDIIIRKFIDDVFSSAINSRVKLVQSSLSNTNRVTLSADEIDRKINIQRRPSAVASKSLDAAEPMSAYETIISNFSRFLTNDRNLITLDSQAASSPSIGDRGEKTTLSTSILHPIPVNSISTLKFTADYWMPLLLPGELHVILTTLRHGPASGSQTYPSEACKTSRMSMVSLVACIISPWKIQSEVNIHDIGRPTIFEESTAATIEILDFLFEQLILDSSSEKFAESLIATCISSSRLALFALTENSSSSLTAGVEEDLSLLIQASSFFEKVLERLRLHFLNIVSHPSSYGRSCVSCALFGLLTLSTDFSNILLAWPVKQLSTLLLPLANSCELFLQTLFSLSLDISYVPMDFQCERCQIPYPEYLEKWIQAINDDAVAVVLPGEVKGDLFSRLPKNVRNQAHLYLILPLVVTLACSDSDHKGTKIVALQIIESARTGSLIPLISSMADECESLRVRNTRLEAEIISVKAAASLPF